MTTSPATLSPTSIPTRHPNARFGYSPVNSPGAEGNTVAFSPTHSQHGTSQVSTITKIKQYVLSQHDNNKWCQNAKSAYFTVVVLFKFLFHEWSGSNCVVIFLNLFSSLSFNDFLFDFIASCFALKLLFFSVWILFEYFAAFFICSR